MFVSFSSRIFVSITRYDGLLEGLRFRQAERDRVRNHLGRCSDENGSVSTHYTHIIPASYFLHVTFAYYEDWSTERCDRSRHMYVDGPTLYTGSAITCILCCGGHEGPQHLSISASTSQRQHLSISNVLCTPDKVDHARSYFHVQFKGGCC